MEKERPNNQNNSGREAKEGYIIVPNYFLKKWVRVLGVGPVVLYQELLTYCHKEKTIAWPTIHSLCEQMGIAKTTLLRYQNTLIKFGLIKNVTRSKSTTGHYRNNIYQIISLEELTKHPDPDKIIDFVGSKMKPDWYQNDTCIGSNMNLSLVSNRYPNNTNLNNNNITTTKEGKDAVADFKKIKEKGEERMLAMKEQLRGLDFEESFIEKILKDFPAKKIEDKIDLLMEKRNIQNPAGWLMAALKSDYRDVWEERDDEEPAGGSGNLVNTPEQASRQKALAVIRLIQDNLSICMSPPPSGKYTGVRENVNQKLINERRCKCPKEENSSLKPTKKM